MFRPDDSRNIAEQNASYRRGVVLGLTMAEAGILIIFVLLLIIGSNEWQRIKKAKDQILIPKNQLTNLQQRDDQLASITTALGLPPTASEEEIQAMVRSIEERAATKEASQHCSR